MVTIDSVGDVLRAFREQRGLTQKDLALRSGYRDTYLSRVENGHVQAKSPRLLKNLATALNLSSSETVELFEAARNSQRTIHLPPGFSAKELAALNYIVRACVFLKDMETRGVTRPKTEV